MYFVNLKNSNRFGVTLDLLRQLSFHIKGLIEPLDRVFTRQYVALKFLGHILYP